MTFASLREPMPTSSARHGVTWVPIPGFGEAEPSEKERGALLNAAPLVAPATATTQAAISIRSVSRPWHEQAGVDGMHHPVERMKAMARELEPMVLFSAPEVVSVVDEDGVEVTTVVVDVFIPAESDGMAFRTSFFGTLADALSTRDLERLAVGVGRLGPAA